MKWKFFLACLTLTAIFGYTMQAFSTDIYRLLDPVSGGRYGKSPAAEPPFLGFGSIQQYYHIADDEYDSHSTAVSNVFSSWNNAGPVQFSSHQSSGLALDVFYSSDGYPGIVNPGVAYTDHDSYIIDASDSYVELNTYHDWGEEQDIENHKFDVETILVHEVGHIHGLAHPLIASYSQDATAPIMAGGDNEYFWDHTARSLRTDDINGTQFLQYNVWVPSQYSTIQNGINNCFSTGTVNVSTGTYNENISMISGIDVRTVSTKQTIGGTVDFDNDDCELEDFFVNETITISNSAVTLDGIESTKSSGTAVSISNYSLVDIVEFKSDDGADVGIYSYYDNEVYLDGIEIEYIDEKALHQPTYDYMEVYDFYFCENDVYDIYKYYSADIYLDEYCTFTDSPPLVCYGVREVEYPTNYYMCSQEKVYDPDENDLTAIYTGMNLQKANENEDYKLGMNLLRQISRQRLAAIQADFDVKSQDFAKEYTEAIAFLKQAVAELSDETLIKTAIGRIVSSYFQLGQDENAYTYLTSLKGNSKYASFLPVIDSQLINYYLRQDDPQTALNLVNDLLAMSLNNEELAAFLNLKGFIYLKHLNDPDQAILCYQEVLTNYSETPSSEFALAQLEKMDESEPDSQLGEPLPTDKLVLEGYPNPFNPTATVRFNLPKSIEVTLIVYDMLGREVVRLVDGFRDAGQYEIIWDGRDSNSLEVSTGIYITKLSTPLETKVIRMLMMK